MSQELTSIKISVNPHMGPGQYIWTSSTEVVVDPVMMEMIKRFVEKQP